MLYEVITNYKLERFEPIQKALIATSEQKVESNVETPKISSQDLVRKARTLADQGQLDQALSYCTQALELQKLDT